jgi:ectoine hydroxylase-related dioxygenase (phytanoyl-CoA dioxygenase family)
MTSIFKNEAHQKEISQKGFVQIPLLSEFAIKELLLFFEQQTENVIEPFHTTHFSTNKNYKQATHDIISKIVFAAVEPLLDNFIPVFGNFMVKQAAENVFMPLHADWTYVDENKYRSIAIWIPLIDTDEGNGCLGVIEGSHTIMNKIRGPRIQQSSYTHDKEWVKTLGKLLPAKAGSAVIYDHGLLHFSPPNRSGKIRPALNLSLVPMDAETIHYCIPEGASEIELYKVENPQFYIHYNNFQRPETGTLTVKLPTATVSFIDEKMKALCV